MSGDALVFHMANSSRKDPSVFVKKDWLAISDDMNQNYAGNQIVIQTSALSNSNKYLDYRLIGRVVVHCCCVPYVRTLSAMRVMRCFSFPSPEYV